MRRCWIAAKADYRPCLSSCTQHRDQWMRPTGECAHKIFFKNLNPRPPRLRIASVGHCHHALPGTTNGPARHRPPPTVHKESPCPSTGLQAVLPPWSHAAAFRAPAACGPPRRPPCGRGMRRRHSAALQPRPWTPLPANIPGSRHMPPALPAGTSFPLWSAATSPRSRAIQPPLTPCPPGARVAALERTGPANAAVRGLARSSTGAASPFARCVSCPPCSRKFS